MTSRWVVDVAPKRNVHVRWRTYSLDIKNEGIEIPEQYRVPSEISRKALRVVEAVWADHGNDPIGRLYTELGTRFHGEGDVSLAALAGAVRATGLHPSYIEAADEEHWDKAIRESMAEAIDHVGEDVGVPVLLFEDDGGGLAGISGPVVSPPPTGDEALALWDCVSALAANPSFYELKRSR